MKTIIPAAGYATSLYPLTLNQPKQLLQIGDKKMLEHILYKVEDISDSIHIISNEKFYNKFLTWNDSFKYSKPIEIINNGTTSNENRRGAIGDMYYAMVQGNINDDCLIVGGDNLFEFNIKDMYSYFKEKGVSVIATKDCKEKSLIPKNYGIIEVDENNRIIGFEEKPKNPKTTLASTMVYMFKKDHLVELHNIMKEGAPDNAGEFIKYLSERQNVHSYAFDEAFYDIGSHEQLKEVHKLYLKK